MVLTAMPNKRIVVDENAMTAKIDAGIIVADDLDYLAKCAFQRVPEAKSASTLLTLRADVEPADTARATRSATFPGLLFRRYATHNLLLCCCAFTHPRIRLAERSPPARTARP